MAERAAPGKGGTRHRLCKQNKERRKPVNLVCTGQRKSGNQTGEGLDFPVTCDL